MRTGAADLIRFWLWMDSRGCFGLCVTCCPKMQSRALAVVLALAAIACAAAAVNPIELRVLSPLPGAIVDLSAIRVAIDVNGVGGEGNRCRLYNMPLPHASLRLPFIILMQLPRVNTALNWRCMAGAQQQSALRCTRKPGMAMVTVWPPCARY